MVEGAAAPLDLENVDTDMIIPKQFLKTIKRTGLGVHAFDELRYDAEGKELESFVLNKPPYRAAPILVSTGLNLLLVLVPYVAGCTQIAGDNFGCGSSREHAPWALNDFGIRAIVSTSFADIFYINCFMNGLLPIRLPFEDVRALMADAEAEKTLKVDLEAQVITRASGETISFDVDAFRKHCLVNGLDDIGLTLQKDVSHSYALPELSLTWTSALMISCCRPAE